MPFDLRCLRRTSGIFMSCTNTLINNIVLQQRRSSYRKARDWRRDIISLCNNVILLSYLIILFLCSFPDIPWWPPPNHHELSISKDEHQLHNEHSRCLHWLRITNSLRQLKVRCKVFAARNCLQDFCVCLLLLLRLRSLSI